MSRTVIRDIVIPIVSKVLAEERYLNPIRAYEIQDPIFEEYLEEELRRRFGIIGANDCQHLREQLEEAIKNDPYEFECLIRRLLETYIKIAIQIRRAKKLLEETGPPDKFRDLRRRYPTRYSDIQTA
ncbi:MAG: hypothetical protein QXN96_00200 [Candidatus Bathyarchaeia archaeon]